MIYKKEQVTVEKHMDGSIHICNKNKRYVLSKEINANDIPKKPCTLPFPPVIGEDEKIIREQFLREKDILGEEDRLQKLKEKTKKDEIRNIRSKNRQLYHKEHGRLASYN